MRKLILFLMIPVLLFGFFCGKKVTGPSSKKPTFTIYGEVVKDMNFSKDIVYFNVWRNDTLYDSATVKVGNKTIPNSGSGLYYSLFADTTFKVKTAYTDSIISSQDTVTITFRFAMPDTFSINPLSSTDSLNRGGHLVNLYWTASDSASGYIISVTKGDTISGANLYSSTVNSSPASIPRETFHTSADKLVTGYYWIYVIAYNRSFVSYSDIPFALPAGLTSNNITGAKGTIGAGVIARKVIIYVTTS